MGKLVDKAKLAMNNMDLNAMIEDIANTARILTNPGKRYFFQVTILRKSF